MGSAAYWDAVSVRLRNIFYPRSVYEHYWRSHDQLTQQWFRHSMKKNLTILKTDMFEESKSGDFFSYEYAKRHTIVGIDISKAALKTVRKIKNMHLVVADIRHPPFKQGAFDLVLSFSTLDHLGRKEFQPVVAELGNLLKPNGEMYLTVDNGHNKPYVLEFLFWKLIPIYERDACYSVPDVAHELQETPFVIDDVDAVMFFPPFVDKLFILVKSFFPQAEPAISRIAERVLRVIERHMRLKKRRILFGRFLAFRLRSVPI